MWLHGWLPVTVSHHPAKFSSHRLFRRGGIIFSIWYVASCGHVIREPCNCILGFASPHVSILQLFVAIRRERNIFFSLPQDLTWLRVLSEIWLLDCLYLNMSHQLAKFCGHKPCQRGYITLLICHLNIHDHLGRESYDSTDRFLSP